MEVFIKFLLINSHYDKSFTENEFSLKIFCYDEIFTMEIFFEKCFFIKQYFLHSLY